MMHISIHACNAFSYFLNLNILHIATHEFRGSVPCERREEEKSCKRDREQVE